MVTRMVLLARVGRLLSLVGIWLCIVNRDWLALSACSFGYVAFTLKKWDLLGGP